jgi:hypothetical protein
VPGCYEHSNKHSDSTEDTKFLSHPGDSQLHKRTTLYGVCYQTFLQARLARNMEVLYCIYCVLPFRFLDKNFVCISLLLRMLHGHPEFPWKDKSQRSSVRPNHTTSRAEYVSKSSVGFSVAATPISCLGQCTIFMVI